MLALEHVLEPVMRTSGLAVPELELVRSDLVAAPTVRSLESHLAFLGFGGQLSDFLILG